jgi:hypothetical protein
MSKSTDPKLSGLVATAGVSKALVESFFASQGVSVQDLVDVIVKMSTDKPKFETLAMQIVVAGVQIRANTALAIIPEVREFPVLSITSVRPGVSDSMNFSAMHMTSHIMAMIVDHEISRAVNKKGNCISGANLSESVSGKVNREIYQTVTQADKEYIAGKLGSTEREFIIGVYNKMVKIHTAAAVPARPAA